MKLVNKNTKYVYDQLFYITIIQEKRDILCLKVVLYFVTTQLN